MTAMSDRLLERLYRDVPHPYRLFERKVDAIVDADAWVLSGTGFSRVAGEKCADRFEALPVLCGWIMVKPAVPR